MTTFWPVVLSTGEGHHLLGDAIRLDRALEDRFLRRPLHFIWK